MSLVKAQAFRSTFNSGQGKFAGSLFCGPNFDLVNRLKAQAVSDFLSLYPDADVARLLDADLGSDPGKLLEELQSTSLFGNQKLVVLDAATNVSYKACIGAITAGFSGGKLLVAAGDLKKSSPLRKEFEASPELAAVICYEQSHSELVAFVRSQLSANKIMATDDVADFLVRAVDGNPALLESEVAKLACFASGQENITAAEAAMVVSGNESSSFDALVDSLFVQGPGESLSLMETMKTQGQSAAAVVVAVTNHFALLSDMAGALESGGRVEAIVDRWKPPVFFKRKSAIVEQLGCVDSSVLVSLSGRLQDINKQVRLHPDLGWVLAERFVLSLASVLKRMRNE